MKNERLTKLSNIRALAIFLVVFGHCIILYLPSWNLYQTTVSCPFLVTVKKIIDIPQMPLFFSLSGFLFAFTHQKKRGFLHLLRNKALRLLVPYLTVGLCFLLPIRLLIAYPGYVGKSFPELLLNFARSTDVGHLWFLPSLFVTFLLAEVILSTAERIPGLKRIPEFCLGGAAFVLYLWGYHIGFNYPPLLGAYNYLLWFAFGYILCIHRDLVSALYQHIWIKSFLLLLNILLAVYCYRADHVRVLIALGIRALYILNAYGAMPEKSCALTEKLSKNSFGIYLFHSPLIYITFTLIPNVSPLIVVFINLVVFGAAAYGLTNLVRRLKLGFLIGE